MKKLLIAAAVLATLGVVSQTVESSIDKSAVKDYLTSNFKEVDEQDALIDFESDEKTESTFWEKLGF